MPLKDPTSYVSLPPGLIYGADDLERETYKALLQVVGWAWVTKWWQDGSARPLDTSIEELAWRWSVTERAAQWRLQKLHEAGYLVVRYVSGGCVSIQLGESCFTTNTQTDTHTNIPVVTGGKGTPHKVQHTQTDNTASPASRKQLARESESHANSLRENTDLAQTACAESPITSISSCCCSSDNGSISETEQQQQTTSIRAREVAEALGDCGLFPEAIAELSADPWVTADRCQRWWANLQRQGLKTNGGKIGSFQAVMLANLRAHREPPAADDAQDKTPYRFIQGKYADFIEH